MFPPPLPNRLRENPKKRSYLKKVMSGKRMDIKSGKADSPELRALARDVIRLSNLFTREREKLPPGYLTDEGLRRAYIHYFLPANINKIHTPLQELSLHPGNILLKERLQILDLGCGPGTAILGMLEYFSSRSEANPTLFNFTAVDAVQENLSETITQFTHLKRRIQIKAFLITSKATVERFLTRCRDKNSYDIIVMLNLLSELFSGNPQGISKRIQLLKRIMDKLLTREGSLILIEPALRETSRGLLMVRDGLLHEGGFHLYAPCLTEGPCPALIRPKDWCHADVPWDPPELIRDIDRLTGLRKDSLKFSYMIFQKERGSLTDRYGDSFRVVSEPLVSKGKMEFYVCGREGRRLVTRLNKYRSEANEPFEKLKRWDIVQFTGIADEAGRLRILKESGVILLNHSPHS